MLIQKSVVRSVTVAELKQGDRLLQDVIGYKENPIMFQGKVMNNRDIAWLKQKLKQPKPKLASERYQTKRKAASAIKDKNGAVLVKAGAPITEEALAPLLKEGFILTDGMDSSVKVFVREQIWPDNRPWRVDQFNPSVRIETVVTINDDIQSEPEREVVAAGAGAKSGSNKPELPKPLKTGPRE
jgi:hypothetical protein